jgi:hypothetical protein
MPADQVVIDAISVDTRMREYVHDPGDKLADRFAKCMCALDSAVDDNPPAEERKLMPPAAAQMEMFNNEKFMSSLYIQHQMNNIMDGKVRGFMGFHTLFIPNCNRRGLPYVMEDGEKRVYTC